MRKYLFTAVITVTIGCLIYLSSIYLAKAELSFKQLAKGADELEKEAPADINKTSPDRPSVNNSRPAENRPAPEKIAAAIPEQKPVEQPGPALISMEFVNANLKDVLKLFCKQSRLNFIAGENVELRPITLYLNNVNIDDALNSIIKANGLTYEKAPGSDVFIVRKTVEPELKLETRIFKLNYASAEDKTVTGIDSATQTIKGIKETVQKLLTPNGDLSIDSRTNSLIVTDIPSRFALIEKSIKDLDSQLPQILIEAKIVELNTADLSQLGIKWSSLADYKFGFHSPIRTYNENRGSGDNQSDQYTTVTKNNTKDELVSSVLGGTASDTHTVLSENNLGRTLTDTLTKTLTRSDIRSAILSADDFTLTLSLLLTDDNMDIISSPNIVTSHGKEAKITIGEKYPIPNYSYNTDTSTWEVQGFEYKDIGVLLRVIPYASKEDNNITVEAHPEVSSISGYVSFGGAGGAKIPIIATREATTSVLIKDGETLAIGGLLKDDKRTVVTKVPLLGDLPILGNIFRHKEDTKTKSNMIIFITPHIIRPGIAAPAGAASEAMVPMPMVNQQTSIETNDKNTVQKNNNNKNTGKNKNYKFGHR